VDGYGLTIVDLNNVDYKDDPWVVASQVAQVLYIADPAKKIKHVVVPGKQDIIGVDGIDDVEEYNQYDKMNLFTDIPQKMRIVEAIIRKDDKPWARKDGESRIVTA
jgi:prophage antirepressor-like protein